MMSVHGNRHPAISRRYERIERTSVLGVDSSTATAVVTAAIRMLGSPDADKRHVVLDTPHDIAVHLCLPQFHDQQPGPQTSTPWSEHVWSTVRPWIRVSLPEHHAE